MWQWNTDLPGKSANSVRNVMLPPSGAMVTVSRYPGSSTGAPLTCVSWNGLTWMWKGCTSGLSLTTVHSSTVSSATNWSTRCGSKGLPSMRKPPRIVNVSLRRFASGRPRRSQKRLEHAARPHPVATTRTVTNRPWRGRARAR